MQNHKTMTLTLKRKISYAFAALGLFFIWVPFFAMAQGTLTLSVSPTLFKMSAAPGQNLSSSVKVINSNDFEITVYADVVNFAPQGESGLGKFLPVTSLDAEGQTLAEWIKLERTEFVIPPERTVEVPFDISLPEDASPGSHSAAILIGTKSINGSEKQTKVETSQVVTTLLFLRVDGDVVEDGSIREFRTTHSIYESPSATFELRFENKGNVHLQPQGDIKIYNMWGNERGVIPVNKQSLFGDVLRESIRKYVFTWSGDWSLADMGRYTAVATLAYGEDGRKFASSETAFWVIPWKILSIIILILAAFITLVSWSIKLYIRRMLTLAGVSPELHSVKQNHSSSTFKQVSVVAPIEAGILDLRHRFNKSSTFVSKIMILGRFVNTYKLFFIVVVAVLVFIIVVVLYVRSANVSERGYEVTVEGVGNGVTISSEQMKYDEMRKTEPALNQNAEIREFPPIKMVNRSGVNGLAATLRVNLEKKGYLITRLENEFNTNDFNTVIVYAPEFSAEALELSRDIKGSLLSSFFSETDTDTPITIYVGRDLENEVQ